MFRSNSTWNSKNKHLEENKLNVDNLQISHKEFKKELFNIKNTVKI